MIAVSTVLVHIHVRAYNLYSRIANGEEFIECFVRIMLRDLARC